VEKRFDPFLTTMLIMAEADQFLAHEEIAEVLKQVKEQRLFLPKNQATNLINTILSEIRSVGIDPMIDWVAGKITSSQGRKTAYRCALAVAHSDNNIHEREIEVLDKLRKAFELSEEDVTALGPT